MSTNGAEREIFTQQRAPVSHGQGNNPSTLGNVCMLDPGRVPTSVPPHGPEKIWNRKGAIHRPHKTTCCQTTCVKLAFGDNNWYKSGPGGVRQDTSTPCEWSVKERPLIFLEPLLSHKQNGAVNQCLSAVGNWGWMPWEPWGKPYGFTS